MAQRRDQAKRAPHEITRRLSGGGVLLAVLQPGSALSLTPVASPPHDSNLVDEPELSLNQPQDSANDRLFRERP